MADRPTTRILVLLALLNVSNGRTNFLEMKSLQKAQLAIFKEEVGPTLTADWMKEDDYLVRYMRAKDWKANDAKKMLAETIQWRKDNNMDGIHSEDWTGFEKFSPIIMGGVSKNGTTVIRINMKDVDMTKYLDRLEKVRRSTMRTIDAAQMELYNARDDNGTRVFKGSAYTCLYNFKGFDSQKHLCFGIFGIPPPMTTCLAIVSNIFELLEKYYLELCDEIIWVNFVQGMADLTKPMMNQMSQRNKDRLRMITEGPKANQEMLQYFDINQLPYEFGGDKGKEEFLPKRKQKNSWDKAFFGRK